MKLSYIFIFIAALFSHIKVNFFGELYITELLLPILAIVTIFKSGNYILKDKIFWTFIALGTLMLVGYMLSDLIGGTPYDKYIRAWGRNIVLISDFISLLIIATRDKNILLSYFLGFSIGVIGLLVYEAQPISYWKLGYGLPLIYFTLIFTKNKYLLTSLILLFFGAISLYFDSRFIGACCVATSGIIFLRSKNIQYYKLSFMGVLVLLSSMVFIFLVIFVLLSLTNDEYSDRRATSTFGRLTAIKVATSAIIKSPILGYGSWGEGTKDFADIYYEQTVRDMQKYGQSNIQRGSGFRAHSQILQAWMEGGILAAFFFLYLAYIQFSFLKYIVLRRSLDRFTPIYIFIMIEGLWNIAMSPYGGSHRLGIALSIAIIGTVSVERYKRGKLAIEVKK